MSSSVEAAPRGDTGLETSARYHFDPVDVTQMRVLAKLPPGRRIGAMLAAQELARGFIMGRLRRQHPRATPAELALRFIEDVSDAGRRPA